MTLKTEVERLKGLAATATTNDNDAKVLQSSAPTLSDALRFVSCCCCACACVSTFQPGSIPLLRFLGSAPGHFAGMDLRRRNTPAVDDETFVVAQLKAFAFVVEKEIWAELNTPAAGWLQGKLIAFAIDQERDAATADLDPFVAGIIADGIDHHRGEFRRLGLARRRRQE